MPENELMRLMQQYADIGCTIAFSRFNGQYRVEVEKKGAKWNTVVPADHLDQFQHILEFNYNKVCAALQLKAKGE